MPAHRTVTLSAYRHARLVAATVLVALGCSDSPAGPDEEIAFLVGDWHAEVLLLRNAANPDGVIDLLELGAAFTLNVQPSGYYTASLSVPGSVPEPELGTLEVEGGEIIFHRQVPSPQTQRAEYTYGGGKLTLEGQTEIDINNDGVKEAAILETTLSQTD